jgi:hypothetical protein
MKFKLNPAFDAASGALSKLVFREVNGKTIVSRKPSTNGEITEAQAAHRVRFRQAAAYGKFAMANPATRAFYQAASEGKDAPAFALCVADFLNLPSIKDVDLSAYHGQPGDTIKLITSDDFGVVNVHVVIANALGTTLESGNAVEAPAGTGRWTYAATAAVADGTTVTVKVTATDRPGGVAISTTTQGI